jgi:hypothetical protein
MATFIEEQEKELEDSKRNMRKLILIENLNDTGLNPKQQKKFIKFYYNNLDMNLLEALDEFKKLK